MHLRRAEAPLVPRGALRRTPAWGALLVSFFIGAALIAALIDIPLFARTTVYPDSQLLAALVLVRFLVALPVGAVVGGYLIRSVSPGVVTAAGMALAAVGFVLMTRWDLTSLSELVGQRRAGGRAGSASASPWRRSTPRCWPSPTTTCTAWRAPSWSWPGWSACWSGSRRSP